VAGLTERLEDLDGLPCLTDAVAMDRDDVPGGSLRMRDDS
jgi:hypothetical protein